MSTTQALKSQLTGKKSTGAVATKSEKPRTVLDVINGPGFQNQIKMALPKNLTPERLTRIVMTEFRKSPKLQTATPASFMAAVIQAAQLGIEPGSALGLGYLVPFMNYKTNQQECQFILGYRGMISLARRSGEILSINAYVVHKNDEFSYQLGLHPDIRHVPSSSANPGPVVFVYAVAQLRGGGVQFEVMSRAEIEAIRNSSQGWKSAEKFQSTAQSPWTTHFDEMAKKTVVRRMFKYLPVSTEANYALDIEDRIDRGESVTPQDVWDGVFAEKPAVGEKFGVEVPPAETEATVDADTGEVRPVNPLDQPPLDWETLEPKVQK